MLSRYKLDRNSFWKKSVLTHQAEKRKKCINWALEKIQYVPWIGKKQKKTNVNKISPQNELKQQSGVYLGQVMRLRSIPRLITCVKDPICHQKHSWQKYSSNLTACRWHCDGSNVLMDPVLKWPLCPWTICYTVEGCCVASFEDAPFRTLLHSPHFSVSWISSFEKSECKLPGSPMGVLNFHAVNTSEVVYAWLIIRGMNIL